MVFNCEKLLKWRFIRSVVSNLQTSQMFERQAIFPNADDHDMSTSIITLSLAILNWLSTNTALVQGIALNFRDGFFHGKSVLLIGASYSAEDAYLQCVKFGAKEVHIAYNR